MKNTKKKVTTAIYLSAVDGRAQFREAYKRERDEVEKLRLQCQMLRGALGASELKINQANARYEWIWDNCIVEFREKWSEFYENEREYIEPHMPKEIRPEAK